MRIRPDVAYKRNFRLAHWPLFAPLLRRAVLVSARKSEKEGKKERNHAGFKNIQCRHRILVLMSVLRSMVDRLSRVGTTIPHWWLTIGPLRLFTTTATMTTIVAATIQEMEAATAR